MIGARCPGRRTVIRPRNAPRSKSAPPNATSTQNPAMKRAGTNGKPALIRRSSAMQTTIPAPSAMAPRRPRRVRIGVPRTRSVVVPSRGNRLGLKQRAPPSRWIALEQGPNVDAARSEFKKLHARGNYAVRAPVVRTRNGSVREAATNFREALLESRRIQQRGTLLRSP